MLQFNELRITPDGKHLIVDVQVQELDYYEDVYIDSICFDTHTSYNATGPSSTAVKIFQAETEDEVKHIRMTWDVDLLKDNLFFVYAATKGTPSADTPCGMKNAITMGVTYNKYPIYIIAMKSLNDLDGCEPSDDLINFSLRLQALDLSLEVGNFTKAIEYWKKFFTQVKQVINPNCGCNG